MARDGWSSPSDRGSTWSRLATGTVDSCRWPAPPAPDRDRHLPSTPDHWLRPPGPESPSLRGRAAWGMAPGVLAAGASGLVLKSDAGRDLVLAVQAIDKN